MKNKLLAALGLIAIFLVCSFGCSSGDAPCPYTLNPDLVCRLTDRNSSGDSIIEFFNIDTNEFRLEIVSNGTRRQLEHPVDKVANFNDEVKKNSIKFDPSDLNTLLVNGERFPVKYIDR